MYFDYLMLALRTLYNCKLQCPGTQGTFTVITALKLQIAIVYKMVIFGAVNVPEQIQIKWGNVHWNFILTSMPKEICIGHLTNTIFGLQFFAKTISFYFPPMWPEKNRQMSIKGAQKWFHLKNEWFWHLYINFLGMWEIWAN